MPFPHVVRPRARRDEAAIGQGDHRVQAERLRRHRASRPGQDGRRPPRVHLERLYRLPESVMDDEQRVDAARAGTQVETVRPELVPLVRINRAGAGRVRRGVEPLGRPRRRKDRRRRLLPHVDELDSAARPVPGRDHLLAARHDSEILRAYDVADEPDLPHRFARRGDRLACPPRHRADRRQSEQLDTPHVVLRSRPRPGGASFLQPNQRRRADATARRRPPRRARRRGRRPGCCRWRSSPRGRRTRTAAPRSGSSGSRRSTPACPRSGRSR